MKEIIIAGRDVRIYIAECAYALKSHDQIKIKGLERYDDQANKIYNALSKVGIDLEKEYKGILLEDKQGPDVIKAAKERVIADRDVRIYIGECINSFGGNNQIMLKGLDKYTDRIIHVFEVLNGIGIELDKSHRTVNNKPKFESVLVNIKNEETGRIETKTVHKLGLTKIPEVINRKVVKHAPKFKSLMVQIENKENGRIETKIVHELGLTKIPELYMYTEPNQEIEYSKSESEIEMFE